MGLRTALGLFPPLLSAAERVNEGLIWLRWRVNKRSLPASADRRLHLGCGDIDAPGFINIDARPKPHVHFVQRVDRLAAFGDDSVVLVYSSHCLEHVSHRDLDRVLAEWHRVLRPGGVLRLSVPDFDLLVETYLDSQREIDSVLLPLMGAQDYEFNFHFSAFTLQSLSTLLERAGFKTIRKWKYGSDPYSSLPDWSGREMNFRGRSYAVSLNLEAVK